MCIDTIMACYSTGHLSIILGILLEQSFNKETIIVNKTNFHWRIWCFNGNFAEDFINGNNILHSHMSELKVLKKL